MNDRPFLDTNVLVYAVGQHDQRTPVAEALLAAGGVVSVQVLNELVSVMQRKLRVPVDDINEAMTAIRALCPAPVSITLDTHEAALRLVARFGWHIYDALIVAAALEAGCATLLSEDLQDGHVIDDRLTILNPFASRPQ